MRKQRQKGSVLIMLIVFIVLTASVGSALFSFNSTSSYSVTELNSFNNASQIALSIKDAVKNKVIEGPAGNDVKYTLSNGNEFIVASAGTITGIAYPGSQFESRRTLDAKPLNNSLEFSEITPLGNDYYYKMIPLKEDDDIKLNEKIADTADITFSTLEPDGHNQKYVMGADNEDLTIGAKKTFGNTWLGGDYEKNGTSIKDGKITTNGGFRVFFMFRFIDGPGDGFTFAIINGANNNKYSCGGDTYHGSQLGYGGNSCYDRKLKLYTDNPLDPDDRGLLPPKFAVEFDQHKSRRCKKRKYNCGVCPGQSGCQYDEKRGQIDYVFWGTNGKDFNWSKSGYKSYYTPENLKTLDDNAHSMIDPTMLPPLDPCLFLTLPAGLNKPVFINKRFKKTDKHNRFYWYCFRMDVDFSIDGIILKSWISTNDSVHSSMTTINNTEFNALNTQLANMKITDLKNAYTGETGINDLGLENLVRKVTWGLDSESNPDAELNPIQYREDFETFLFGWTSAAGGAKQVIEIVNFGITFIP